VSICHDLASELNLTIATPVAFYAPKKVAPNKGLAFLMFG
jgi:hypothetical protein|tara:strand:+ start:818 stop:937 length:120 start_codon:yes stop_codon:yes gene_type:complete